MTTILVDRKAKLIAADKQMTCGDSTAVPLRKIYRIKGNLIAVAGTADAAVQFREWYKDQKQPFPDKTDFEALVLYPNGELDSYSKIGVPVPIKGRYYASGSGGDFALGAVHAGASLREAVLIANKLDIKSGLGVQVEGFKNGNKQK